MLFWILLGLIALAVVLGFTLGIQRDSWGHRDLGGAVVDSVWLGGVTVGISLIIMLATIAIFGLSQQTTSIDRYGLHALNTPSQLQGEFFLGSGYIGSSQEFSYLQIRPDGAIQLGSIDPDDAVVYEDGGKYMTITHSANSNPWLLPFGIPQSDKWAFHVPKGSVESNYSVTTSGK